VDWSTFSNPAVLSAIVSVVVVVITKYFDSIINKSSVEVTERKQTWDEAMSIITNFKTEIDELKSEVETLRGQLAIHQKRLAECQDRLRKNLI
jgi:peptidoglycan hydrolase CwlO-like protein